MLSERSKAIITKWKNDVRQRRDVVTINILLSLQYTKSSPSVSRAISLAMNTGWMTIPTAKSVAAIEASIKWCVVWSLGFVLTAIMTSTFRMTVGGQVSKFWMMESTEKSLPANWSSKVQTQLTAFEAGNEWLELMFIAIKGSPCSKFSNVTIALILGSLGNIAINLHETSWISLLQVISVKRIVLWSSYSMHALTLISGLSTNSAFLMRTSLSLN